MSEGVGGGELELSWLESGVDLCDPSDRGTNPDHGYNI